MAELLTLVGLDPATDIVLHGADGEPPEDDGAHALVVQDVRLGAGDRLIAPTTVREQRDEVRHRAGRHEERGFLAHRLGGRLLEGADRRVLAHEVVPDLGAMHRLAHLGGGPRHGVRAEVDDLRAHGGERSIGSAHVLLAIGTAHGYRWRSQIVS